MKNRLSFFRLIRLFAFVAVLSLIPLSPASAQDAPPANPVDLPCATNISAQMLGATPIGDGSQTLVSVRIIFDVNGNLGPHTHPGTLVATVESGTLGFMLRDTMEMSISRAATADSEATSESLTPEEEVALNPGDGFVETGMLHSARNLADEPTTVVISGLIETGQPLTQCAEVAGSPAM